MSTILNSLKKSSDQRKQSEDSSLENFSFVESGGSSAKRYLILLVFLVLFAAASYYVMNNYIFNEEVEEDEDSVELSQTEKSPQPINKIDRPDAGQVKQSLKDSQAEKKPQDGSKDVEQGPVISLNERIAERKRKQEELQKAKDMSEKKPEPDPIQEPKKAEKSQQKPIEKPKIKEVIELTEDELIAQQYQLLHQLPFSIRKDLPSFKLNVHIYDQDPEKRVAIINGMRFYINDMIEQTVLVKDIVKFGVLLEVNGKEFLIPR